MYLFQVFSKKEFLMEKEDNCKTLSSLMEAINYLIAYHDETNHYLQIQLMKYQTMFDHFDHNSNSYGIAAPRPIQSQGPDMSQQQEAIKEEETTQEERKQEESPKEVAEPEKEEKVKPMDE